MAVVAVAVLPSAADAACEPPELVFEGQTYRQLAVDPRASKLIGQGTVPFSWDTGRRRGRPDFRVAVESLAGVPRQLAIKAQGVTWVATDARRADVELAFDEATAPDRERGWLVAVGAAAVLAASASRVGYPGRRRRGCSRRAWLARPG